MQKTTSPIGDESLIEFLEQLSHANTSKPRSPTEAAEFASSESFQKKMKENAKAAEEQRKWQPGGTYDLRCRFIAAVVILGTGAIWSTGNNGPQRTHPFQNDRQAAQIREARQARSTIPAWNGMEGFARPVVEDQSTDVSAHHLDASLNDLIKARSRRDHE